MSECNCKKSSKTRPNETCLFCCNKHLSAALALLNNCNSNQNENILRVASQIKLASWHFNINFNEESNECNSIIQKILNFQNIKNDLINLIEHTWNLLNSNKNTSFEYHNTDVNIKDNKLTDFLNGLLCISNAIELYQYESSYKDVNMSYILGQLILASWQFQKNYKDYSIKLRAIYNSINNENLNIDELIEFKSFLWKKYVKGWL